MGMLLTVIRGPRQRRRHVVEANGGEGARHGGDDRGQDGDCQGGVEGVQDAGHPEAAPRYQSRVEAVPYASWLLESLKEKTMSTQNGGVEEQKDQRHEEAAEREAVRAHSITACSSPSPKRFMIAMQTSTMTIITSAMAEPRWGL